MILTKLHVLSTLLCSGAFAFSPASPPITTRIAATTTALYAESCANDDNSRRSFLSTSAIALMAGCANPSTANAGFFGLGGGSAGGTDYKAVANDIAGIIKADPDKGPTLLRLAWHSSGTYDKMSKDGGSGGGTIRFKEELAHGGNAGLGSTAVVWMEDIKKKYGDSLSYADLYTLGGVVAIKELGGPTIKWSSGRVDALDPSAVTPDGRLPNADVGPSGSDPDDATHLRTIFGRMGFDDQEIVALSGAHALGRCHTTASGFDGPWTPTPTMFNNLYFSLLNQVKWTKRDWSGPFQYEDDGKKLMMLPTDLVLIQDDSFKKYVDVYAKDQDKFFQDFSKAFNKLEELGTTNLKATEWA
ncbi:hypothetical protein ACHAXR_009509 [Thalassiosira sp. AJA248-18]